MADLSLNLLDSRIRYSGVWQKNDAGEICSYWNISSLEFKTNSDYVDFDLDSTGDIFISIDGVDSNMPLENNIINIKLENGWHAIKLFGRYDSKVKLRAIKISADAEVAEPDKRLYIQFIGDSISHYDCSFSFRTPKALGVDYSVVAQGGMSLHDGWGWYEPKPGLNVRRGMESSYHHLEFPCETAEETSYDFKICRTPDVIVIFLGTNDFLDSEQDKANHHVEIFAESYKNFVGRLREKFPEAKIYMLEALSDKYCRVEGIEKAYETVSARYENVTLVRSDTWGVELCEDETHPTYEGYTFMSEKLAEYLKKELQL